MTELQFKIGDQVIHWVHGPGEIIQLEENDLSGHTRLYYVVQMRDLQLWVPVDQSSDQSLRFPTPKKEFKGLFQILANPALRLSPDRNERRLQLKERLKDRKLASICGIIRDLTLQSSLIPMNGNDKAILEHSRNVLLYEWSNAFSISIREAEMKLETLLHGGKKARSLSSVPM